MRRVWEYAGIVGVNPVRERLTLWQLETMAIGRMDEQWNHTVSILATVINCHRDPKRSRAARPDELRPTFRRDEPVEYAEFGELKELLMEEFGFHTTGP